MRRILTSGVHAGLMALLLAVAGCDGGAEDGVPKDTTPVVPLNSVKAEMTTRNVPPGEAKKADTATTPAPATKP